MANNKFLKGSFTKSNVLMFPPGKPKSDKNKLGVILQSSKLPRDKTSYSVGNPGTDIPPKSGLRYGQIGFPNKR